MTAPRPIPNPKRRHPITTTPPGSSAFPTLATAASHLTPTPLHQAQRRNADDAHHMPIAPAEPTETQSSSQEHGKRIGRILTTHADHEVRASRHSRAVHSHRVAAIWRLVSPARLWSALRGAVPQRTRRQRTLRTATARLTERLAARQQAFYGWLESRIFPRVVSYATHPVVILLTILLLVPLTVWASLTWLALILGNYTNVVSAAVSSIVLATSLKHHAEVKQLHQQHGECIAAIEARMTSRRHKAAKSSAPDLTSSEG